MNFYASIILHLRQSGFEIPLDYSLISDFISLNPSQEMNENLDISNHEKKALKRYIENISENLDTNYNKKFIDNKFKKLNEINNKINHKNTKLLIVTKTRPLDEILKLINLGFCNFGENRVQEARKNLLIFLHVWILV